MQPDRPNPSYILSMIFIKMISAAGAKEVELQGASSANRVNAAVVQTGLSLHTET
jgi:hypothetical protein